MTTEATHPESRSASPGATEGSTDDQAVREAMRLLEELDEAQRIYRLHHLYADTYANGHHWIDAETGEPEGGPYPVQVAFHNAGATKRHRGFIAANQVGKSRSVGAEVAMHLIGWYPEWWTGKRFDRQIEAMACGETNQDVRDICQEQLLGKMVEGQPDGSGWIPQPMIGEHKKRQCGTSDVIDYIFIRHASGGWSKLYFKSYEQNVSQFQGFQRDLIWADEEPSRQHAEFLSEMLTRLMKRKGILLFSRTPLQGMTPFIRFFMRGALITAAGSEQSPPVRVIEDDGEALPPASEGDIGYVNVGWEDTPHFSAEQIALEIANTPEHLRLAKSKGIPQLGSGPVYTLSDDQIAIDAFDIPDHWRRLCAMDFGVDHPTAAVWIAHDPETDLIVLYDAYRQRKETALYHAQAIKSRGDDIPVAWPHDGLKQEPGSGQALRDIYDNLGLKMLPISARYDDDRGGGQSPEPAIEMITDRMRTGRFKVFRHLHEWFDEKRMYHRENGHIVKIDDDLMAATNYVIMMLRYARIVGRARRERMRTLGRQEQSYRPLGRFSAGAV